MEHLLLKAATTVTDEGVFEAVISTASPDRDGDIVEPSAMAAALAKWGALGKLVPLAYLHTDEVIGHVDPGTVRLKEGEVIAQGWVDQGIPRGEEVWRLVKSGTLSFSFGYLIPEGGATKRPGGRYRIKELDVFEISAVPVGPANNDTRVLGWKSADALAKELHDVKERLDKLEKALDEKTSAPPGKEPTARSEDALKNGAMKAALGVLTEGATPPEVVTKEEPKQVPELDPDELRKRSRDLMVQVLTGTEVT